MSSRALCGRRRCKIAFDWGPRMLLLSLRDVTHRAMPSRSCCRWLVWWLRGRSPYWTSFLTADALHASSTWMPCTQALRGCPMPDASNRPATLSVRTNSCTVLDIKILSYLTSATACLGLMAHDTVSLSPRLPAHPSRRESPTPAHPSRPESPDPCPARRHHLPSSSSPPPLSFRVASKTNTIERASQ